MSPVSHSASRLFSSEFANLSAQVLSRLSLEWRYHQRPDLEQSDQQLLQYALEFGRLLKVVYKYDLFPALREECKWYVAVFRARGSSHDAFALVLDSWIMAVEGLLKPPECNELARPIRSIRNDLDRLIEEASNVRKDSSKIKPELLEKLIGGDFPGAREIISGISPEIESPDRLIVRVMLPAMAEVGQRWEFNELEIFQEHLATEVIRILLAGLMLTTHGPRQKTDEVALVSCIPGDEHELIPLALASYLALRGWIVRNLGVGLPADQIARAVAVLEPKVLFLTCTMLSTLDEVLDVIDKVQRESGRCRIILGGRGAVLAKAVLERRGVLVALDFDEGFRLAREGSVDA